MAPGKAFRNDLKAICEIGGTGAAADYVGIGRGEAGGRGILARSFQTVNSQWFVGRELVGVCLGTGHAGCWRT